LAVWLSEAFLPSALASVMPDEAPPPVEPDEPDFTVEQGYVVFTAAFHRRRGECCGSGCRHCPFSPRHHQGATTLAPAGPTPPGR